MRMWMINPKLMCRKHLLGEHVELHMFEGHLRMGRKIAGYIESNCVEVRAINKRHNELVKEMRRRKYRHNSPLDKISRVHTIHLSREHINARVNVSQAQKDLFSRCPDCKQTKNKGVIK